VLTVTNGADLVITGSVSGTSATRIEVAANATANITLNGVSIVEPFQRTPILLGSGAKLTLMLGAGTTNTLTGDFGYPGITVPSGTTLTIGGEGRLTVSGGRGGAGIGTNGTVATGTITINGGIITATGGNLAAGIGGGWNGILTESNAGGTVTISGGTVTAIGGGYNLCIGPGGTEQPQNGIATFRMTANAVVLAPRNMNVASAGANGILFIGNNATFYGTSVTPTNNFTVPDASELTVPSGRTLTIKDGVTMTVAAGATLTNNGTIYEEEFGTIVISGVLTGANKITPRFAPKNIIIVEGQTLADVPVPTTPKGTFSWKQPLETSVGTAAEPAVVQLKFTPNNGTRYYEAEVAVNFMERLIPTEELFRYTLSKTYNGNPQGADVAAVSGVSGLGGITVKYNGSTAIPANAGIYAVTVDLAQGTHYAAAIGIPLGSYTINPGSVTVTATSGQSKVYGASDLIFGYAVSGNLIAGNSISGALGRAAGEDVGTYAINQGTLTAGNNYGITFVGANFTITPKPIAVMASPASKAYGGKDPVFGYTASEALASGNSFSGALGRAAGENVGTYPINQGTLTAGENYKISFVSADFTITKAAQAKPVVSGTPTVAATSVVLPSGTGWEYGIVSTSGIAWQDSPIFLSLKENTAYEFAIRMKETANNFASEAVSLTATTHTVSVLDRDRKIPVITDNEAVVLPPLTVLSSEFTAGPNPVARSAGAVGFYRQGGSVFGELAVYDVSGNVIRKISITDKSIGNVSRRLVGEWDLRDAKGYLVSEGTYLVRGAVKTADGKKEKVSVILGVR
jgi:hypothetical protein